MEETNFERHAGGIRRMFRRLFRREADGRIRARVEMLRASGVFAEMPTRHLHVIAEVMHERHFRRDEYVYFEGDPGLGMYLISRGRVRLTRQDENDQAVQIAELGESDVFGLLSVFEDLRRQETVQSTADTIVLGLFRPDLNAMSNRSPAAAASVYRALGRRVGRRLASVVECIEESDGRNSTLRLLAKVAERQGSDQRA